jgi:hypothetical protein
LTSTGAEPRGRRLARAGLFAAGLLAAAGCGLADYEERMLSAQSRARQFDEENQLLDEPITVPTRPDAEGGGPLADVFFRPPKGFQSAYERARRFDLLWCYPRAAGAPASSAPFKLVGVAFAGGQKDFAAEVVRCFSGKAQAPRERTFQPFGRKPLVFDCTEIDDGQDFYSVNISRTDLPSEPRVALVFGVEAAQRGSAARVLDLSLGTLATGADAAAQRLALARRSPFALSPAERPR